MSPGQKKISQLDYIHVGRDDEVYINNEERRGQHGTSPFYKDTGGRANNNFTKGEEKKWTGWKPKSDEQTMEFKKRDGKERR